MEIRMRSVEHVSHDDDLDDDSRGSDDDDDDYDDHTDDDTDASHDTNDSDADDDLLRKSLVKGKWSWATISWQKMDSFFHQKTCHYLLG